MLNFDLAETKAGQEIFQEGMEKGIEKGMEKGIEKGKRDGLLQDAREMVLDNVDVRFGIIPEDIVKAVKAIQEIETLRALHRKIFHCENIETLRELLKVARGETE